MSLKPSSPMVICLSVTLDRKRTGRAHIHVIRSSEKDLVASLHYSETHERKDGIASRRERRAAEGAGQNCSHSPGRMQGYRTTAVTKNEPA